MVAAGAVRPEKISQLRQVERAVAGEQPRRLPELAVVVEAGYWQTQVRVEVPDEFHDKAGNLPAKARRVPGEGVCLGCSYVFLA